MKITDAYWELRNLGISAQEVEIESRDTSDQLRKEIPLLDASYQVVKVPTGRMDIYPILRDKGFSFAEASIKVSHTLKEFSASTLIERIAKNLDYEEMNAEDIVMMKEQILKGLFQTDRVVLDPYFSSKQAANRYIMWIDDERERGSRLFVFKYRQDPVGFTCMRETEPGVFYPVLGGIYNIDKPLPLGNVTTFKQLEIAKSLDGKVLYTVISSNNNTIVRAYSQLGYAFDDIRYVFVKHIGYH